MIVDHVTYVATDAAAYVAGLRERHGLGALRDGYHPHLGTRGWNVPLAPPTYLEILEVEDEPVAAGSELGRRVLDLRDAGGGLIAWSILVDDIHAVAARVGIAPYEGITRGAERTMTWYTVAGADLLPIFIQYGDDEAARRARWQRGYELAGHECAPTRFCRLDVSPGRASVVEAWLGPHDLPVRWVGGPLGLRAVAIATDRGEVEIR